ncbi:dTMP kinase [Ilumatobacter sp.]|uniref:dTMP kinase n=1 Tax=Ilumatobacter sp. TaxID=1967498 RepID=UPI003AF5FCC9
MPVYIAFEGAEACGKSTHTKRLAASIDAVVTRETGGTEIGRRLRDILHDTTVTDLDDHAETLIVAADRAQHLAEVVRPALAAGRHVVSDRSVYSTLAYQGHGRGLPIDEVHMINAWAIGDTWPDLVILLTVPADVTERRMSKRDLDRFEMAGDDFHARVDQGFASMAADDPDRWVVVDASGSHDDVTATIRDAVRERLGI